MTRDESLHDPALRRLYEQHAGAEPSAQLDQAIISAARQACAARPGQQVRWWRQWSAPFALAATVVLATLLNLTMDKHPESLPAPPGTVPAEQSPAPVEKRDLLRSEQAKPESPAERPASVAAPAAAKAPSGKAASSRSQVVAEPSPFPKDAPADRSAPERPVVREAIPLPDAPAKPSLSQPSTGNPAEAVSGAGAATGSAGRMAPAASSEQNSERAAKRSARTPEMWIEEIRALRRQGRLDEAQRRLSEFRSAFPDYRLPDDLMQP